MNQGAILDHSANGSPKEMSMKTHSLTDLYVDELRDLYSAEQQILKALPKMSEAATHSALRHAFETHRQQTERHVGRLQQIFEYLGESPKGRKCDGVEGIIKEGADLIDKDIDGSLRDAGLIAAAQRVEHYEMAVYGSVRTWAEQLGRADQASLLQQTLDEEKETNELLTRLAVDSVNRDAMSAEVR
jgi:ferritin-like metal-binding protein YciE